MISCWLPTLDECHKMSSLILLFNILHFYWSINIWALQKSHCWIKQKPSILKFYSRFLCNLFCMRKQVDLSQCWMLKLSPAYTQTQKWPCYTLCPSPVGSFRLCLASFVTSLTYCKLQYNALTCFIFIFQMMNTMFAGQ